MSHFAKIENDKVVSVIVAEQEFIDTLSGEWIQTSYNTQKGQHTLGGTPLRGNFASVGGTYDRNKDVFIPIAPSPSWVLDSDGLSWIPPTPNPDPENPDLWIWIEDTQSWVSKDDPSLTS